MPINKFNSSKPRNVLLTFPNSELNALIEKRSEKNARLKSYVTNKLSRRLTVQSLDIPRRLKHENEERKRKKTTIQQTLTRKKEAIFDRRTITC